MLNIRLSISFNYGPELEGKGVKFNIKMIAEKSLNCFLSVKLKILITPCF